MTSCFDEKFTSNLKVQVHCTQTNLLGYNQIVHSPRNKVDGEDEDPTTTTTTTTTDDHNDDLDKDPTTTTTTTTHKDQLKDDPQDSTTEGNTSVLRMVASSGGPFDCRTGFVQHSVNVRLEMSFRLTISSWILMGVAFKNYCTLVPFHRCTKTFYGTFESDVTPPSTNSPFSD